MPGGIDTAQYCQMKKEKQMTSDVKGFISDTKGGFALLTGLVMPMLALTVGLAIDGAQLYSVKQQLRSALDSAVTSTARDITTGKTPIADARKSVEMFLTANGVGNFIEDGTIKLDKITVDQVAKTLSVDASVDTDLVFPVYQISGMRTVAASSAAVYSDKTIEVAMVLDITGSMGKLNKLQDLQAAAKNAVNLFLDGQDPSKPRVRVSVVPYSASVNTGVMSNTVYVETSTSTDTPPSLNDPKLISATSFDGCATERKTAAGGADISDASPYVAMVNRDDRLNYCPKSPLQPLTADQAALDSTINGLKAGGYTAGHIGIQWGWYMLSPNWKNVLPAESRPENYNSKKAAKYAIIMTDGEFNTAYAGVPTNQKTDGNQTVRSNDYAEQLCSEMKKDGIEIFTVGFMLDTPSARDVLSKCASKDTSIQHFYEAADGAALKQTFEKIAANIERLALTK